MYISLSLGISLQKHAGGWSLPSFHYNIQQETHYIITKPQHTSSRTVHDTPTTACSKVAHALVSVPDPTPKMATSRFAHTQKGIMAKIWRMHFSCRRWMRNYHPTNSGLIRPCTGIGNGTFMWGHASCTCYGAIFRKTSIYWSLPSNKSVPWLTKK